MAIKLVKYIGLADKRVISVQDWKKVNLKDSSIVWDRSNGWVADISKLSSEAQQYIEADTNLIVINEETAKQEIIQALMMKPPYHRGKAQRLRGSDDRAKMPNEKVRGID